MEHHFLEIQSMSPNPQKQTRRPPPKGLKMVRRIALPNAKFPMSGGGVGWINFPTFDAESKSTEVPNSLCPMEGGGGLGWLFNF